MDSPSSIAPNNEGYGCEQKGQVWPLVRVTRWLSITDVTIVACLDI